MSVGETIEKEDAIMAQICERIRRAYVVGTGATCIITVEPDGQYTHCGTQRWRFVISDENGYVRYYSHYAPEIKQVLLGYMPVHSLWINLKLIS